LHCNSIPRRSATGMIATHRGRLSRCMAFLIVLALIGSQNLYSEAAAPTEYEVKAAYLYNLGKFVEWPARTATTPPDPFSICVLGHDPFGATLDTLIANETINGKSIVVKRLPKSQDAVGCNILFISSSEEGRLKDILSTLDKANVLTVSDMPQFTRHGGMIQFVLDNNRVRFEINLTSAEHAGLVLSSQLLKVAINVRRDSHPGGL
jgi:hypothetical protein